MVERKRFQILIEDVCPSESAIYEVKSDRDATLSTIETGACQINVENVLSTTTAVSADKPSIETPNNQGGGPRKRRRIQGQAAKRKNTKKHWCFYEDQSRKKVDTGDDNSAHGNIKYRYVRGHVEVPNEPDGVSNPHSYRRVIPGPEGFERLERKKDQFWNRKASLHILRSSPRVLWGT